MGKAYPTQKRLHEVFDYHPDTGDLVWKIRSGRRGKIGMVAGHCKKDTGYIQIGIDGVQLPAHRLIWLYIHGTLPKEIDHINHNKTDNRLCNLRNVDRSGNQRNRPLSRLNSSGIMGVGFHKKNRKWRADIRINGNLIYLGSFDTIEEATAARKAADILHGFHENHGSC